VLTLDDGYRRRLGQGMRQAIRPAVAMSVCRVRIHEDVTCAHSILKYLSSFNLFLDLTIHLIKK
jgi:hypothetical protein